MSMHYGIYGLLSSFLILIGARFIFDYSFSISLTFDRLNITILLFSIIVGAISSFWGGRILPKIGSSISLLSSIGLGVLIGIVTAITVVLTISVVMFFSPSTFAVSTLALFIGLGIGLGPSALFGLLAGIHYYFRNTSYNKAL